LTSGALLGTASGLAGITGWKGVFELHPNPPAKNLKQFFFISCSPTLCLAFSVPSLIKPWMKKIRLISLLLRNIAFDFAQTDSHPERRQRIFHSESRLRIASKIDLYSILNILNNKTDPNDF
jgi:hypothetical protein